MSRLPVIVLLAAAVGLSGCVSMSRSETVTGLPADWVGAGRIESITVAHSGLKVTPRFEVIFLQHVRAKLDACATGSRPLRLEATLERFDKANPVITTLVAGANVLRGSAKLIDVSTGQVVADYKVGKTIVGGRFAIVVMGEAEEQMSDAYGDELCAQAFPKAAMAAPNAPG